MIVRLRSKFVNTNKLEAAAALFKLPGFGQLSERALARLVSQLETSAHPDGSALIREGEIGDHLFIVAAGKDQLWVKRPASVARSPWSRRMVWRNRASQPRRKTYGDRKRIGA